MSRYAEVFMHGRREQVFMPGRREQVCRGVHAWQEGAGMQRCPCLAGGGRYAVFMLGRREQVWQEGAGMQRC